MTDCDRKLASRFKAIGKSIEENAERIAAGTPKYTTGMNIYVDINFKDEELDEISISYNFLPEGEIRKEDLISPQLDK